MKMNRVFLVLIIVLSANLFVSAQSPGERKQIEGEQKLIPGYKPGPPEELNKLHFMIGKWELTPFFRQTEKDYWFKGNPCISTFEFAVDGAFIRENFTIDFLGTYWKVEGLRSYDKFSKKYRKIYFDHIYGLADIYEGDFENDKLTESNEKTGTHFISNDKERAHAMAKTVTHSITKNSFIIDWYGSTDGKTWANGLRWEYKRIGT